MLGWGWSGRDYSASPTWSLNARDGVDRAGAGGPGDPVGIVADLEVASLTDAELAELTTKYPLLRWFDTEHLKDPVLVKVVNRFRLVAVGVARETVRGPEVTVCLRKLLEAKDAAVRAYIESRVAS